jgi:hypothetical protein
MESINSINNIPISGSTKGDLKIYLEFDEKRNIIQVYDNLNEIDPNVRKNL